MEKQIWKYTLTPGMNTYQLPKNAHVLHADEQYDGIHVWAEVDPNAETEDRCFEVFGTGHPIHYDMGVERKYISTVKIQGGAFVFHVYERIN